MLFLILGVFGNEGIEGRRILDTGAGGLAIDAFDQVRQHPAEADLGEHVSTLIGQRLHALLEAHRMGQMVDQGRRATSAESGCASVLQISGMEGCLKSTLAR